MRGTRGPKIHDSDNDDTLEPLAVYDQDGHAVELTPADADISAAGLWKHTVEVAAAAAEVLADATQVRAQQPWVSQAVVHPITPPRGTKFIAAFSRMTGVHPAQLPSLPEWWRQRAADDRVRVTSRLSLEAPRSGPSGSWRMRGRLRRPFHVRSTPVELLLWPHLGAWTKLLLEPQTRVHTGNRYFAKGHRSLDVLTERLSRELVTH